MNGRDSTSGKSDLPFEKKPQVDRFDSATASLDDMTASMKCNGGIIIRNFLSHDIISTIESEVRPHLEADTPWDGSAFPPQTRRVTGALAKSKTFREKLIMQPQFLALSDALLSVTSKIYWGDAANDITARAQIGGSIVFCVNPGAEAQPLHRDDIQWHQRSPKITAEEYESGRDASITLFVAGCKLTKENGATRFCPGSHLEQSQTAPNEANAVYAEMDKGDALVMLSSCYHGGSANTTVDQERLVYSAFSHKGYLRQGENQYVVIGNDVAATWDDEILGRIGYACSAPSLGFVNFMDPMMAIKKGTAGKRMDVMG